MSAQPYHFGERPFDPMLVGIGIVFTLIIHGLVVGAMIVGTLLGEQKIEEELAPKMLKFEEVELLALGEDKPPEELPRIPNPEKAVKPPEEINLAKPEEPVIDLKKEKAPEKEDMDARQRKMAEALSALNNPNRPTNDDTPAGSEEGAVGGQALKSMLGSYATKLVRELGKNWELPTTVTEEEAKSLAGSVKVYVRMSEDGHIVSFKFKKESSNEQFDASIARVLKKFQVSGGGRKLPMPDEEAVKDAVVRQGINLRNWEYTPR